MTSHRSRNPRRVCPPRAWPVLAVLALGLLAPTTASAQTCEAPPGTSGIEQYCESIQGPGGKAGPGDRGSRGGRGVGGPTARELRGSGSDGRAVLGLAGGSRAGSASGSSGAGSGEDSGGASASQGSGRGSRDGGVSSVLSGAMSAIGSGSGLVWILIAIAVVLAGVAWLRFRRGGQGQAQE